jgi:Beta-lactamase enzyme family
MVINPLRTHAMRAYLSGRSGVVTAAVEDLRTGQTWTYHAGDREQTGSIIKVDILETLLRQAELSHTPLDSDEVTLVQGMIEDSDNNDAQDLWSLVGESTGIGVYDAKAGLTQTVPNTEGYWGETTTSAVDQIRLLRELVMKHSLLNIAFKHYELGLMEHVEADQAWGVSAGVPPAANIALKNGWLPLTTDTDWEINSIGRVKGAGRWYLIAILTAHDPSESYGITTTDRMSSIVWSDLASTHARGHRERICPGSAAGAGRRSRPALSSQPHGSIVVAHSSM